MQKDNRILLSAYSCNPMKGSEPGIGWNWVIEISKLGYSITVITRTKNQRDIARFIRNNKEYSAIDFVYHDLSPLLLKLKKFMGVYLYYELWQLTAYYKIKGSFSPSDFRFVHHITFGAFRQPSYLYKLKIPFFFGSVGGGEYAPPQLLKNLPLKFKAKEKLRECSNKLSLRRSSLRQCLDSAVIIFCKTQQTLEILPSKYHLKSVLQHDIGQHVIEGSEGRHLSSGKRINVLFAGRLIYWKGAHLAIHSFYKLYLQYPNVKLTLIGDGPFRKYLERLVSKYGFSPHVEFVGNISHAEVFKYYSDADIFLFPTLHDSSGTVILEALKYGLPTICLDTGGPSILLTSQSPTLVDCRNIPEKAVIGKLSELLIKLATDTKFYEACSNWSLNRIKALTWERSVRSAYQLIELSLCKE